MAWRSSCSWATGGLTLALLGRGATLADPPPAIGPRSHDLLDALDPNTATAEELAILPGIGPGKAAAIVAYRQGNAFAELDDLQRVRGIGPSTVAKLRPYLVFGSPSVTPRNDLATSRRSR